MTTDTPSDTGLWSLAPLMDGIASVEVSGERKDAMFDYLAKGGLENALSKSCRDDPKSGRQVVEGANGKEV